MSAIDLNTYTCPFCRSVESQDCSIRRKFLEAICKGVFSAAFHECLFNTHLASVNSSPASARVKRVASAPNFLTASPRVKKLPVLFDIFFPFNIR